MSKEEDTSKESSAETIGNTENKKISIIDHIDNKILS